VFRAGNMVGKNMVPAMDDLEPLVPEHQRFRDGIEKGLEHSRTEELVPT